MSAIRLLIVDDHQIVREGVSLIIEREPDMRVIGTVATGEEAIAFCRSQRPDITLMDLQLRTISGAEAIQAIRQDDPRARIIVLTMYEGDEHIARALRAGAATYLLKDTLSKELIRLIREVHAGHDAPNELVEASLKTHSDRPHLTPREIQVLELVVEGRRNKEIASLLNISEETVPVHLRNIFTKLEVNDRTAAITTAIRRGFLNFR